MTLTTQGWQKVTSVTNALIVSLPWLIHFACTALQLNNIASVMYGRAVEHIPHPRGYTMGLLMWWRGPRGPIHYEEI